MKPAFRILADGADATAAIRDRLIRLEVADEAGIKSDTLSIELDDRAPHLSIPRTGVELELELGWGDVLYPMGRFVADEPTLQGPPERLRITARAANVSAQATATGRAQLQGRASQSWHDTTLGAVLADIGRAAGYPVKVSSDIADVTIEHIDRVDESALHLLARISPTYGMLVKVGGGVLTVTRRGSGVSASGEPMPVIDIRPGDCGRWEVKFTERGSYAGVRAHWHDMDAAQRTAELAGSANGPVLVLRGNHPDRQTAQAAAQAKLAELGRGKAELRISLSAGDPRIAAESRIRLVGFRAGVDGLWGVKSVRHQLASDGLTSSIEGEAAT